MLKKILALAVCWLLSASFCAAQTAPKEDPHRGHDQRARECRKLGLEQQLQGEELLSFVANCMKAKT